MAITSTEFLKASVVFLNLHLLPNPDLLARFRELVRADVMGAGVGIGIPLSGEGHLPVRSYSINRDRIVLECSQARSSVSRDYPDQESLDRLAQVTGFALDISGGEEVERPIGYNVEIVLDQDSGQAASAYLGEKLFSGVSGLDGWTLSGGTGSLSFEEDKNTWNLTLEPRLREDKTTRVYLSVNLHRIEPRLPTEQELSHHLHVAEEQAVEFARQLDGGHQR